MARYEIKKVRREDIVIKENILKEKLIEVENNRYLLENDEKYFSLALEMMDNIGLLDPKLRDNLIYGTLSHWILNNRLTFEYALISYKIKERRL